MASPAAAPPGLVDTFETARRLGVRPRHVRDAVAAGRLPVVRIGRLLRFRPGDIDAFTAANRVVVGAEMGGS